MSLAGVFRQGKRYKLEQIFTFLDEAVEIYQLFTRQSVESDHAPNSSSQTITFLKSGAFAHAATRF